MSPFYRRSVTGGLQTGEFLMNGRAVRLFARVNARNLRSEHEAAPAAIYRERSRKQQTPARSLSVLVCSQQMTARCDTRETCAFMPRIATSFEADLARLSETV
jgi:hypothetical protein